MAVGNSSSTSNSHPARPFRQRRRTRLLHSLSFSLFLHRICRYCYQLSKAPHIQTHTRKQTPALHHLCRPSCPSHTSSLRALRLRLALALALASAVEWQKLFTYRFASHGQVTYASVPVPVCVCVFLHLFSLTLQHFHMPFIWAALFFFGTVVFVGLSECAICGMRCAACGVLRASLQLQLAPAKWLTRCVFFLVNWSFLKCRKRKTQ